MASERNDQPQTDDHPARVGTTSLSALSGLSLPVKVRIGSASISVGELLELAPGAVLTLDQRVDDDVEVLIGDRVVARGELVSVGEEMGVRITEIVGGPANQQ